jgi:hypothetical protein
MTFEQLKKNLDRAERELSNFCNALEEFLDRESSITTAEIEGVEKRFYFLAGKCDKAKAKFEENRRSG